MGIFNSNVYPITFVAGSINRVISTVNYNESTSSAIKVK